MRITPTHELFKEFHKRSNVVAVMTGEKFRGGKPTGERAIVFFVAKKIPKSRLSSRELIPEKIEGTQTDVQEGMMKALGAMPMAPEIFVPMAGFNPGDPRTGKYRPAPGGVSCGHPNVTAGTLGTWCYQGSDVRFLSNNHVIANKNQANIGDNIYQPGVIDGGWAGDEIGTLHDFEVVLNKDQGVNVIDAAICKPNDNNDVDWQIAELTQEVNYHLPAVVGMPCTKSGRTTKVTQGVVTSIDFSGLIDYNLFLAYFLNQIFIQSTGFIQGGDSGSALLQKPESGEPDTLIGLCFAGSVEGYCIANPILPVVERFGLGFLTPVTISGQVLYGGSPVAGAWVLVYNKTLQKFVDAKQTDAQGNYEFIDAVRKYDDVVIFAHSIVGNYYRQGYKDANILNVEGETINISVANYEKVPDGHLVNFKLYSPNWLYGDVDLEQYISVWGK